MSELWEDVPVVLSKDGTFSSDPKDVENEHNWYMFWNDTVPSILSAVGWFTLIVIVVGLVCFFGKTIGEMITSL